MQTRTGLSSSTGSALEGVVARKARVLGKVDPAHAAAAEKPHDGVARKGLTSG